MAGCHEGVDVVASEGVDVVVVVVAMAINQHYKSTIS